ncbi:hypothetical protein [Pseudomonas aeruginosa]|uniref:hypothetical protein n=1 Tax=Pseudomonas aeruginosa TaxID=287 RepID=UPI003457740D
MNDRELLELAARAAGMQINEQRQAERDAIVDPATASLWIVDGCTAWNSLTNDGDALRLAVRLNLDIRYECYDAGVAVIVGGAWDNAPEALHEIFERDGPSATRRAIVRAIVRAAAEIGKSMGGGE